LLYSFKNLVNIYFARGLKTLLLEGYQNAF